jgi:HEAT repeat protein
MALSHLYSWLVQKRMMKSGAIWPENQKRLRDAALRGLSDEDRTVQGNAASLLGQVGDATVLPTLRAAHKKESYFLTKQMIADAIKAIEERK